MKNKHYPLYKINPIDNLRELLEGSLLKYPTKIAFRYLHKKEIKEKTYLDFFEDVRCLSTAILQEGLRETKIALLGDNSYYWIVCYLAIINSGNIIVPLDHDLSEQEICNLITNCQTKALFYSSDYIEAKNYLTSHSLVTQTYWNLDTDFMPLLQQGKLQIDQKNCLYDNIKINNNSLAAIIYTSGTTGNPKGVMLSHHNLASNIYNTSSYIEALETSLLVLPLHHTFAMTAGTLLPLYQGKTIAINTSLKQILTDLNTFQPQIMAVVPMFLENFYNKIWDTARKNKQEKMLRNLIRFSNFLLGFGIDLRKILFQKVRDGFGGKLELIVSGGAPLDNKYIVGFRELGIQIINGYGITECSPIISLNRLHHYKDSSVGIPLPECTIQIANPDSQGIGEIWVQGPQVMLGYYQNSTATQQTFEKEWFKTGDLGFLDNEGFLYITGRIKNLIILSNGKNIYPEELEQQIMQIPIVKEVMVRYENGRITAEIFPNENYILSENINDINKYIHAEIQRLNMEWPIYKQIQSVKIRSTEFPKTTTKKIKRSS